MAKVKANIVIHICSSIAWQAGAQPVSQPPAPGKRAAADDSHSVRLLLETSDTFFARREAEEDWGFPVTKKQQSPTYGGSLCAYA